MLLEEGDRHLYFALGPGNYVAGLSPYRPSLCHASFGTQLLQKTFSDLPERVIYHKLSHFNDLLFLCRSTLGGRCYHCHHTHLTDEEAEA